MVDENCETNVVLFWAMGLKDAAQHGIEVHCVVCCRLNMKW